MADNDALSATQEPLAVARLIVIEWEREASDTLELRRAALLNLIEQMLHSWSAQDTSADVLFSGQTIIYEDIAQVRADLHRTLLEPEQVARLKAGPLYVDFDGLLTDGESIIRNFLLGRADADRKQVARFPAFYATPQQQYAAQLPQILRDFDINLMLARVDDAVITVPFLWKSPGQQSVLVMPISATQSLDDAMRETLLGQPDGPVLQLQSLQLFGPSFERLTNGDRAPAASLDDFDTFSANLRAQLPDGMRPVIEGELQLARSVQVAGRFSTLSQYKRQVLMRRDHLRYHVEPLLALALTHRSVPFRVNQRALLEHNWRLVLQNLSRVPFSGQVGDHVVDEMTVRNQRILDNSQHILAAALQALPGTLLDETSDAEMLPTDEIALVVWNGFGHTVTQAVGAQPRIAHGYYPATVYDPDHREVPFSWDPLTELLNFVATVPSAGYSVYTLRLSTERTAAYNRKRIMTAEVIGTASGESLALEDDTLNWSYRGKTVNNLLSFHDGGDVGDALAYVQPTPDVVVVGSPVDVVKVEATPLHERLIFRNRLRIAPELIRSKGRERGVRALDITTYATYSNETDGIEFTLAFNNTASDHRLRAHLRTGITEPTLFVDTLFGFEERMIRADEPNGTQTAHSVILVTEPDGSGVALLTRGMIEFEPIMDDEQLTLALTLVRSVACVDNAQPAIRSQALQQEGEHEISFLLLPQEGDRDFARLLRTAQQFNAPMQVMQYATPPEQAQHTYLSCDDDRVVVTAMKPAQDSDALIVRLLNPTPADIGCHLNTAMPLRSAHRVTMAETDHAPYELVGDRRQVNVTLEPYQVVSIRLAY